MTVKEKFIRELQQAFAIGDIPFILNCMTEDIEWEMVGGKISRGKANIKEEMASMNDFEMLENKVDIIIADANLASSNGTFKIKKNGEEKAYGFCDIYEFKEAKNLKISKMISYVILLNGK